MLYFASPGKTNQSVHVDGRSMLSSASHLSSEELRKWRPRCKGWRLTSPTSKAVRRLWKYSADSSCDSSSSGDSDSTDFDSIALCLEDEAPLTPGERSLRGRSSRPSTHDRGLSSTVRLPSTRKKWVKVGLEFPSLVPRCRRV